MLVYSTGKETHWYFLEAIGNEILRESQHFKSQEFAEICPKNQLIWTHTNGENTCSGCSSVIIPEDMLN